MIRRIREQVVVLINPVSNPDGRDKVVEWFYRFLKGKTDYGALPRQSPPYWSKYAFVDINRDTHQQVHETTKAVHRMFHEWHPTVVHDLHEAIGLMLTWNGTGPYNPHIDPITHGEFLELGFHEVRTMTALGMPGVSTWNFGEAFGHHYLDSVAMNHNSLGRGYETWGNATAETVRRTLDASSTTMEWYRPLPPPRDFVWSARDNLNYTETGVLAALDRVAQTSKEMLRSFYKKGYHSWRKGQDEAPYAFVIPEDQGDRLARRADGGAPARPAHRGLSRARAFEPEGGAVSQGLVRGAARPALSQLRRGPAHAAAVSEVGWRALRRHLLGVSSALPSRRGSDRRRRGEERHALTAAARGSAPRGRRGRRRARLPAEGHRAGGAPRRALPPREPSGLEVAERAVPFRRRRLSRPAPGSSRRRTVSRPRCAPSRTSWASTSRAWPPLPDVPRHDAPAPRLGVWVPWADTDSIGWIRYSLDQRRVPYTYVRDEDIRGGRLREQGGRAALRPRGPRARRADPRTAQAVGPDALQEDRRRPRATARPRSRTTSPAASAGRAWPTPDLRRGRRPARDPGQRQRPRPRRRHRPRRAPGRRAACPEAARAAERTRPRRRKGRRPGLPARIFA